jgi:hypothetical protein
MNSANANLVDAWIHCQRTFDKKARTWDENTYWALEQLTDMCSSDPESAWSVILDIVAKDMSDQILADVGAGPMEDLLCYHGALVDRVESCARSNPPFERMLGIVWGQNRMSEDVWNRLKAIAPPSC